MIQYKTVAGPAGLTIKKKGDFASAVSAYADVIQREANDGWELAFIQEIPVERNKGCLAAIGALLGICSAFEIITFNMLVFKKEI